MTVLSAVATVSGILLILVALNDVFQTLLRPSGTGRLTHLIFRLAWSLRRTRRVAASAPLTILAVIIVWVSLVTVGWALIYLPHMPDGFAYQSVDASDYHPFAEALTMSMVALTTLGLGDVVPSQPVLRFVSPLEALMGFALLSASVSWFMQVYPALARRRAFDLLVHSLSEARTAEDLAALSAGRAADLLTAVTDSLSTLTADLVQNSEIFYFGSASERMSAPHACSTCSSFAMRRCRRRAWTSAQQEGAFPP
ncbi:potassium channel family protein [Microbacterium sp. ET2]|uniref:potassium channel family protein n=1 Tax=Microbacterium albipurpureum TaxID=3050384 RepID=UPI00259CD999|nr:potassium channel family protein [Microbacterium sp. ET2 (Ac-2212)]WJL94310.1 potassium channel family protein [Microbacterium sp. ET2 (Ac-2212)]